MKIKAWLAASDQSFHSAINITRSKLSPAYNLDLNGAKLLLSILDIKDNIDRNADDTSRLTESQRKKIEFADKLKAMGIDESNLPDLAEFQAFQRQREAQRRSAENKAQGGSLQTGENDPVFDFDGLSDDPEEVPGDERGAGGRQSRKLDHATVEVMRDIARRAGETPQAVPAGDTGEDEEEEETDQDEYTPPAVDYHERIERAKQKSAADIQRITRFEELQERALALPKYSFGWFKALLEMEHLNSGKTSFDSRKVSISFAKVEPEPGTQRTLILKHPSQYIPQSMEDLADIPLVLHMGNGKKTVAIEVANVRSYTLRVKLKKGEDTAGF